MGNKHEPGRCAMRGSCGTLLPCPDNGASSQPESEAHRELLVSVCGDAFNEGPVCCSLEQVQTMQGNFQMAYPILSSCPACRNNFVSFFCAFTCSPNQSTFLNVTSTQPGPSHSAVKSVDFSVSDTFGKGFYDSCKSVKFGASNGYALDLMAPGATDYHSFLSKLGEEKPLGLGSPFQIDFPPSPSPGLAPLELTPRSCSDLDLGSRCPCIHCPDICPSLPDIPTRGASTCHVGSWSCLSFFLVLCYSLATATFISGYILDLALSKRRERKYERVALSEEGASDNVLSPILHPRPLVGASSLTPYSDGDGENSLGERSESRHLGRGASLLDPMDALQPRHYRLNTLFRRSFYGIGLFCASHPWLTFCITFAILGVLNGGWKHFEVETDPVRLWVASSSESKLQKEFFDQHFGPFYRTEQIFITAASVENASPSDLEGDSISVLSYDLLRWWLDIENQIRLLKSSPNNYQLNDVCFKPQGSGGGCVVQSIGAWFGNDVKNIKQDSWRTRIQKCATDPVDTECLPEFMLPLSPPFVLGGIPQLNHNNSSIDYAQARALVVTYLVNDSIDEFEKAKAEEWERALRQFLVDLSKVSIGDASARLSFSTAVSLEEEINKSTNIDLKTVVLSYVAMFFYISLSLGAGAGLSTQPHASQSSLRTFMTRLCRILGKKPSGFEENPESDTSCWPSTRNYLVHSKFTLGLFGISLVILSISSSVGFFSFIGVKITLIIAEVIPFLVLAVGVDNIFILIHELNRQNALHGVSSIFSAPVLSHTTSVHRANPPETPREQSVDGTSITSYLAPEERIARTLAKMGPSILLSSLTQTIAFALGAIVPMPAVRNFALYAAGGVFLNALLQLTVFVGALAIDLRRVEANRIDCIPCLRLQSRIALSDTRAGQLTPLVRFIRKYYVPILLRRPIKIAVCLFFGGISVLSVISMQTLQLGFDQRLALPAESYLISYFDALDKYFEVGPPVYFVVTDMDVVEQSRQQMLCAGFTTCSLDSVANRLEAERKRTPLSHLSQPPASWIDDFLNWLNPEFEDCCRVRRNDPAVFCNEGDRRCQPCYLDKVPPWNITMNGFPEGEEFYRYLRKWLSSPTSAECPLGGKASYGAALSFQNGSTLAASHFRSFNSPLKTQTQFIDAFEEAHRIAREVSQEIDAPVFPYSPFYVFFDQYTHIIAISQEILGLGLASTLAVTSLILGSWRAGLLVTTVVCLTVVSVIGVMSIWGIMLNAISLVNLVISLGISVEFCSHIARAFMGAGAGLPLDHSSGQKERDERVWLALSNVGPSVLFGVTLTKLIGMSVLAFTRSRLLEIYYFRMWISLIISGALHGFVLLPILLSIAGGPGYVLEDEDEEWLTRVSRRHEYEYRPFRDDEQDSFDSGSH